MVEARAQRESKRGWIYRALANGYEVLASMHECLAAYMLDPAETRDRVGELHLADVLRGLARSYRERLGLEDGLRG